MSGTQMECKSAARREKRDDTHRKSYAVEGGFFSSRGSLDLNIMSEHPLNFNKPPSFSLSKV